MKEFIKYDTHVYFDEEKIELILVSHYDFMIEEALNNIRAWLLHWKTISVAVIMYRILKLNGVPEGYEKYVIDNIDEFDNTYIETQKCGRISCEYVTSVQGIKRAS